MKVKIKNLNFKCIIGILPFERKKKQRVNIDISFKYDYKDSKFIDYSQVVELVEKHMKKEKFELIEEAIISIKKQLIKKYKITKLIITITKPDILPNCEVSVSNK